MIINEIFEFISVVACISNYTEKRLINLDEADKDIKNEYFMTLREMSYSFKGMRDYNEDRGLDQILDAQEILKTKHRLKNFVNICLKITRIEYFNIVLEPILASEKEKAELLIRKCRDISGIKFEIKEV